MSRESHKEMLVGIIYVQNYFNIIEKPNHVKPIFQLYTLI